MKTLPALSLVTLALAAIACPRAAHAQAKAQTGGDITAQSGQIVTDPDSAIAESRQGVWLVQAKCLSVTTGLENIARWQIDSVFNGPDSLVNKTFNMSHRQNDNNLGVGSSQFVPASFVPNVNEEALLVVQLNREKVTPVDKLQWFGATLRYAYGVRLPIGQNHPSPPQAEIRGFSTYGEALSYAQTIKTLTKAENQDRIRLLQNYARSSFPVQSSWAISTLAAMEVATMPKLLLDLADEPRLPVAGPLALEQELQILAELNKVDWTNTPTRLALWHRIVTAPATNADANRALSLMDRIAHKEARRRNTAIEANKPYLPLTDVNHLFEWLRLAADNARWTPRARAFAIALVGNLSRNKHIPRATAWEYLLPFVQAHPDYAVADGPAAANELHGQLAIGGMSGIISLKPFTPDESATLQALQARAKSSNWKRLFVSALRSNR